MYQNDGSISAFVTPAKEVMWQLLFVWFAFSKTIQKFWTDFYELFKKWAIGRVHLILVIFWILEGIRPLIKAMGLAMVLVEVMIYVENEMLVLKSDNLH